MNNPLSSCCRKPVITAHGCDDDLEHGGKKCTCEIVTSWYECSSCKKPTDPAGMSSEPLVESNFVQVDYDSEVSFCCKVPFTGCCDDMDTTACRRECSCCSGDGTENGQGDTHSVDCKKWEKEKLCYCGNCETAKRVFSAHDTPVITNYDPPIDGYITTDTLFALIDKWKFYELRQYQNEKKFQWAAKANNGCLPWGKGDTANEALKDLYIKLLQHDEKIAKLRADREKIPKTDK